ncbi:SPOR domain-containing protein [Arsenophonus endosymbiont of Bemisia tabaci]|uniref:SPOR domain-containing protein n=1 Tax=Arsenophonus endosymbiont of Bemisia tabaci TaxID=536059 RepID=UPI0030B82631
MTGIAVLVLLLLTIAISSPLKAPTDHEKQNTSTTINERNINISKSISLSNESPLSQEQNQPQNVTMPSISDTPTESSFPPANQGKGKRIEIPGDVVHALRQGQTLPNAKQQLIENPTPTPSSTKLLATTPPKIVETIKTNSEKKTKPIVRTHTNQSGDLLWTPASNYTLQLSSASRSDSLEAFAKNNRLTNYKIYKTIRDKKEWYVLIHGNYCSASEAKNAISTLPASVQEKNPGLENFSKLSKIKNKELLGANMLS